MIICIRVTSYNGAPLSQPIFAEFNELGGNIGRAEGNALVLHDPTRTISRTHASVAFRGGGYVIRNLGTAIPVYVNDQPLSNGEHAAIAAGDEIRIGGYTMQVAGREKSASIRDGEGIGPSNLSKDPLELFGDPPGPNPFDDLIKPSPGYPGPQSQVNPLSKAKGPFGNLGADGPAPASSAIIPPDFDPPPEVSLLEPRSYPFVSQPRSSQPEDIFDGLSPLVPNKSIDELWDLGRETSFNPLAPGTPLAPPLSQSNMPSVDPLVVLNAVSEKKPSGSHIQSDDAPELENSFHPPKAKPDPAIGAVSPAAQQTGSVPSSEPGSLVLSWVSKESDQDAGEIISVIVPSPAHERRRSERRRLTDQQLVVPQGIVASAMSGSSTTERAEVSVDISCGTDKRINAWISERTAEPARPLALGECYTLNLGVGEAIATSMIGGESAIISAKDLKGGGLQTEWVINTSAFELASADTHVVLSTAPLAELNLWTAKFLLWIPEQGESGVRRLSIIPRSRQTCRLEVLIFAIKHNRSELYRQFSIEVPVEGVGSAGPEEVGTLIRDELIHAPSIHMNLGTVHEWMTPPGKLDVTVIPGILKAYVKGDLPGGRQSNGLVDWYAQQASLAGPITNVRAAMEKFRGKWDDYLNDIDAQDLEQRIAQFAPIYDWTYWQGHASSQHTNSWEKASKSQELRDLAIYGHNLYETILPAGSQLRVWVDALTPGYRVDIFWDESSGPGYVPNVPWGLMYLPDPPAPGEAVDPMGFLALRFRLGYWGYRGASEASKALGSMANTYQAYCLYWGDHPDDDTRNEAVWQRQQFQGWQNHIFIPEPPDSPNARSEVIQVLSAPPHSPTSVIYLFCQASIDAGNRPVLRFGATSGTADVLQATDLLGKPLADQPLVFANACTTSAADPYIANLLQQDLFRRGCRGFLGTETKVPIRLASRFATIYFNFFYRKMDSRPMAAGEALAQTRLFLLTEYANIGGICYAYLNQYELYMADDAEVAALRT